MAKQKDNGGRRNNSGDNSKGKNQGSRQWINEGQSDYDRIRKGAEITPKPEKPKDGNSDKK